MAPDDFLLQVIAMSNREALDSYIEKHQAALEQPVLVVQNRSKGKDWHVLLIGPYKNRQAAKAARNKLPRAVRNEGPWIRRVSSLEPPN